MLYEKIKKDQVNARKEKLSHSTLLTTLLGEAQRIGKDAGNREPNDAEVLKLIEKFIKNNQESINNIDQSDSRYEKLCDENDVLYKYMPSKLSENEIRSIVMDLLNDNCNNMGRIMSHFKTKYTGQYDGKELASIVKSML